MGKWVLLAVLTFGCDREPPLPSAPRSTPAAVNVSPVATQPARLQGDRVHLGQYSFRLPKLWLDWHQHHPEAPNLHLSQRALDRVRMGAGEWDTEFAQITNELVWFGHCQAHVGGEGWGKNGLSYIDLQVRVYLTPETPAQLIARAQSKGTRVVQSLAPSAPPPTVATNNGWSTVRFSFPRFYQDYGANAIVDMRMRRDGKQTIVFAFMHTDQYKHLKRGANFIHHIPGDKRALLSSLRGPKRSP